MMRDGCPGTRFLLEGGNRFNVKKLFLILTALFILQKWSTIYTYLNPPPDYSTLHGNKVILYATAWCGYCTKARAFLNERGIAYHEYDIEKSKEGHAQYRSLGGSGVPVLLVNGTVVKGFNPNQILALLQK